MGQTLEIPAVGKEELSSPHRPIGAESSSVQGHSQHRTLEVAFRHDADDMRVMVLNPDQTHPLQSGCVTRGEVPGMQIVSDKLRRDAQQLEPATDLLLVEGVRCEVGKITNVLRDVSLSADCEAERGLEFPAGSENGRRIAGDPQRRGDKTPGPPHELAAAIDDPQYRVVAPVLDGPVVGESRIGYPVGEQGEDLPLILWRWAPPGDCRW